MDLNSTTQVTNGTYFKEWWQTLPLARKKRIWIGIGIFSAIWLAGAIHAPTAVAGIARQEGLLYFLSAICMGGFSFLWRILEATGLIQETMEAPNIFWMPLALLIPGIIGGFLYILSQPPNPLYGIQKMLEQASRSQGRVEVGDLQEKLAISEGIPLTEIDDRKKGSKRKPVGKTLIGLDYKRSEGHVMVVAPTRAGKGLHLTDTLRHYPGPALIVDPKGEQFQRTAALRRKLGPVYRIPGHQVHLSAYYRHLRDRDEAIELHYHLLRPWASSEPIFAEKALSLFLAAGPFAQAMRLNALRVLLDFAESHPVEALTAMRTVIASRRHIDIFTNGAAPDAYQDDKFVTSALGNFTTRLAPYQKHIDTVAPPDLSRRDLIVPPDWASQNSTIYITYSLNDLRAVGGVVAAMIAAILRYQMKQNKRQKMLVAIDELPAIGLRNIADYLSTCGGYGMTMLLYVQSVGQLLELYGRDGTRAILSNCDHQLWYPAAEMETAKFMSELYGTTLKASPMQSASRSARQQKDKEGNAQTQMTNNQGASWSWREGAALSPNEMMALPKGQVLVTMLTDQRYTFLGQRLNSIPLFDKLPPPDGLYMPKPFYRPRRYTDWQKLMTMPLGSAEEKEPEKKLEQPPETAVQPEADTPVAPTQTKSKPRKRTKPGHKPRRTKLMG
ncbi:MAG: hypothetical protein DHS20C20_30260 [Ardenticatenaceae bacterium]|nr:MAG: hypothetical protein DHS20C20_30260 [Ardenticatenaceae bacterium]